MSNLYGRIAFVALCIFVAPQIWAREIRDLWRKRQHPTHTFRKESVR